MKRKLKHFKFNLMELAGSFGDLGVLLPIAISMVAINGIDPVRLFLSISLSYIFTGIYFGVTVPIQPMKVISAYAIAFSMNTSQIAASSLLLGIILLILGLTGTIKTVQKYISKAAIRGVQLSTGILLIINGAKLIIGTSKLQLIKHMAEPYLQIQFVGPIEIGIIIGLFSSVIILLLLNNDNFPASLVVISIGLIIGIIFGNNINFNYKIFKLYKFDLSFFIFPSNVDFIFSFFNLVLPQLPMTLSNAVLAYTDLSKKYFGKESLKVSNRKVCISMALINFLSFYLGGIPLCHGAGGLAAHYKFGARTAGSNLIIGFILLILVLMFGKNIIIVFNLIPLSILGTLLIFAGLQLALIIYDINNKEDLFISILVLGITLASNLAIGFITGIVVEQILKLKKITI